MTQILAQTIDNILTPAKGILAADESVRSANRNLEKVNIEGTEENRRKYRELIIDTNEIEKYVSGIILFDETFNQKNSEGKLFREVLRDKEIEIIIKVDTGTVEFPNHETEVITSGLDELDERLLKYFTEGARAAKWRSVFKISDTTPTKELIDANATGLALYALYCQKNNIVPIVEPEVLLKGNHSFIEAQDVTSNVLRKVFQKLDDYKVDLSKVILKSSMVLPGSESEEVVNPEEIAKATVEVFEESVPQEIPGIVFLSGGQGPMQATTNLNEIAVANKTDWFMTFSFSRAILFPATETWQGKDENIEVARQVLMKKLRLDSFAMQGKLHFYE